MARGSRQMLQRIGVSVQQLQHQTPERLLGDVAFCQTPKLDEHLLRGGFVGAAGYEIGGIEAVGMVGLGHGPDVMNLDLRSVFFMFSIRAANLEELTLLP